MAILRANKVFTLNYAFSAAPAAVCSFAYYINNYNRTYIIKSFTLDLFIYYTDVGGNQVIVQPTADYLFYRLQIGGDAGRRIADAFENIDVIAGGTIQTGNVMYMYRPGQLVFENFFTVNRLYFLFYFKNNDIAKTLSVSYNFIAEIYEKGFYE